MKARGSKPLKLFYAATLKINNPKFVMSELSDSNTTVQTLRDLMEQFVSERDWHQFHSPKNLAMSLSIEAAELMEHFQWLTTEQSQAINDETKHDVGEELADVLCYAFSIANSLNIDITSAVYAKMEKNQLKYPAEQFRGRYGLGDSPEKT
jgi:NTP pyrophosphatase (non-canonical NTP hydrolase)